MEEGELAFHNGVDPTHMNIYVAKLDSMDYNNKNKTENLKVGRQVEVNLGGIGERVEEVSVI